MPKLNIQNFGSSSSGNCTCIWDEHSLILIDCGFSARYINNCLRAINKDISYISAVFISHIHGDHVRDSSLNEFLRHKVPVYCHEDIYAPLLSKYGHKLIKDHSKNILTFTRESIKAGSFFVSAFSVPHDSAGGCFGYNILRTVDGITKKISIATDAANTNSSMLKRFADSNVIILESNYDLDMLKNSGRPSMLIDRIINDGHLSNEQCAAFISEVLEKSDTLPNYIMLTHVSPQCNTNEIAVSCLKTKLIASDLPEVNIIGTFKDRMGQILSI